MTKRKENKKVRVREPARTTRTVMEKTRKTTVRITKMMVRKKTTKEEMAAAWRCDKGGGEDDKEKKAD